MKDRLLYLDKDKWPVEGIKGHPVFTFIRRLLWTRKVMRYSTWLKKGGIKIDFS